MASTARYRKQVPIDVWSIRERLALASSVLRSGDQNWVSVSRAIKPFAEPNRPNDWFSQKNCALQYAELLEKVETPKRKRADRVEVETPGNQIVRKLTIERIEEMKQLFQEEQQKYKKLKAEIECVKAGQFDHSIKEYWEEMLSQKKAAEEAAAQKLIDDAQARLEAQAKAAGRILIATPARTKKPDLKLKMGLESGDDSTQDSFTDIETKVEEESGNSNQSVSSTAGTPQVLACQLDVKPRATPPSSPLLSSLLQNKHELQKLQAQQQQKQQLIIKQTLSVKAGDSSLSHQLSLPDDKSQVVPVQIKVETNTTGQFSSSSLPSSSGSSNIASLSHNTSVSSSSLDSKPVQSSVSASSIGTSTVAAIIPKCDVPSSPSAGAPTLSRLLVIPPVTGTAPIKISSILSQVPPPPTSQAIDTEVTPSKQTTQAEDSKGSDSTIITTNTRCTRKESDRTREEERSEKDLELPGGRISSTGDDEIPASPASSIISNETDSGSTRGKGPMGGKRPGKMSTGGKAKISATGNRRTSGRIARKNVGDKKDPETGSKQSDGDTTDDDLARDESDDAGSIMTPRQTHLSESVPNSPASASHSDTEDEKAYKLWKKSIMLVWRAAANHKYANVFLHPVTNEIAPGYRSIVHRPMDLSTIKKNIESGVIRTTQEFQRDMMLMFTNAIMYNNSDHDVHNMAQEMYSDVMQHIYQYVNTQMTIQSETKVLRQSRRSDAAFSDKEDELKKRKSVVEETGGKSKKRKL